jgi:hypothetical protein
MQADLCRQWVGAEPVVTRRPLEAKPDDQHDAADERHEEQQKPPAGGAGVVQPAHGDGNAGEKYGETPERPDWRGD